MPLLAVMVFAVISMDISCFLDCFSHPFVHLKSFFIRFLEFYFLFSHLLIQTLLLCWVISLVVK